MTTQEPSTTTPEAKPKTLHQQIAEMLRQRVQIASGPYAGLTGITVDFKTPRQAGRFCFQVRLETGLNVYTDYINLIKLGEIPNAGDQGQAAPKVGEPEKPERRDVVRVEGSGEAHADAVNGDESDVPAVQEGVQDSK